MECITIPFLKLKILMYIFVFHIILLLFRFSLREVQLSKLQKWQWKTAHTDKIDRHKAIVTASHLSPIVLLGKRGWTETVELSLSPQQSMPSSDI